MMPIPTSAMIGQPQEMRPTAAAIEADARRRNVARTLAVPSGVSHFRALLRAGLGPEGMNLG